MVDFTQPNSKTRRGRVQGKKGDVCPTIMAQGQELYVMELCKCNQPGALLLHKEDTDEYFLVRIRKLTPRECYRLMGVNDEDATKMLEVNSNTQCYKQAGNSIVVDVMCRMFEKLVS